jgi:hypothetical protein
MNRNLVKNKEIKDFFDGKIVFDVGAGMGLTTKIFTSLGSKVIADTCYPAKYGQNFSDAILINTYISDHDGGEDQYISNAPLGYHQMPSKTLDTLIVEYGTPIYIKISTDGYEDVVLRGLTHAVGCISAGYTKGRKDCFWGVLRSIERLQYKKFIMVNCGKDIGGKFTIGYLPPNISYCRKLFKEMHLNKHYRGDLFAFNPEIFPENVAILLSDYYSGRKVTNAKKNMVNYSSLKTRRLLTV